MILGGNGCFKCFHLELPSELFAKKRICVFPMGAEGAFRADDGRRDIADVWRLIQHQFAGVDSARKPSEPDAGLGV